VVISTANGWTNSTSEICSANQALLAKKPPDRDPEAAPRSSKQRLALPSGRTFDGSLGMVNRLLGCDTNGNVIWISPMGCG